MCIRDRYFGNEVSLAAEDVLMVGAKGHNGNRGKVYIFTRSGTTWSQVKELLANETSWTSDQFGTGLDVSGNTIVMGAVYANTFEGAMYAFVAG